MLTSSSRALLLAAFGFMLVAGLPARALAQEAGASDESAEETVQITATIYVVNHIGSDLRVYVVGRGARYQLGTVFGYGERKFEIPTPLLSDKVRFLVGSFNRPTRRTRELFVFPGDVVEWRIEKNPIVSSIFVWSAESGES